MHDPLLEKRPGKWKRHLFQAVAVRRLVHDFNDLVGRQLLEQARSGARLVSGHDRWTMCQSRLNGMGLK